MSIFVFSYFGKRFPREFLGHVVVRAGPVKPVFLLQAKMKAMKPKATWASQAAHQAGPWYTEQRRLPELQGCNHLLFLGYNHNKVCSHLKSTFQGQYEVI